MPHPAPGTRPGIGTPGPRDTPSATIRSANPDLAAANAKYVMRIEVTDRFDHIAGGKGGYWEDRGYEWYAGI